MAARDPMDVDYSDEEKEPSPLPAGVVVWSDTVHPKSRGRGFDLSRVPYESLPDVMKVLAHWLLGEQVRHIEVCLASHPPRPGLGQAEAQSGFEQLEQAAAPPDFRWAFEFAISGHPELVRVWQKGQAGGFLNAFGRVGTFKTCVESDCDFRAHGTMSVQQVADKFSDPNFAEEVRPCCSRPTPTHECECSSSAATHECAFFGWCPTP